NDNAPDKVKPKPEHSLDGWVFESLCRRTTRAYPSTLMLRRELFERHGGFISERNWEDTEFELRLALETQFVAVGDPLTVIRAAASSISREHGLEGDLVRDRGRLRILDAFAEKHHQHERYN